MRTLLVIAALMAAAIPAHAKVILNSFDENGKANARAAMREEAVAKGEEIPPEAQEYTPPQNAWSASWAAAHSKIKATFAGTEEQFAHNAVESAKKDLARAERKGNPEAVAAAKANLEEKEAKLARLSVVAKNQRISTTEHWDAAKDFTRSAMEPIDGRETPIPGFEDKDE